MIGVVIGARVVARRAPRRTKRAQADIEDAEKELPHAQQARRGEDHLGGVLHSKMRELLVGKTTASRLVDDKGKVLLPKGEKITLEMP